MDDRGQPPTIEEASGGVYLRTFYPRFRHKPLTGNDTIRLIKLVSEGKPRFPGGGTNLNIFEIVERSLNDKTLEYATLSYAWGEQEKSAAFIVREWDGDYILPVTPSAWEAANIVPNLEETTGRPILLWVDQLCIDQSNRDEVSEQVKLMSRIYREGWCCAIWLGAADEDTENAFSLLHMIEAILPARSSTGLDERQAFVSLHTEIRQKLRDIYGSDILPPQSDPGWPAFAKLLKKSWHYRLWTFQEAVLSFKADAMVLCGPYSISLQTFMRTAVFLGNDITTFGVNYGFGRSIMRRVSEMRINVESERPTPLVWLLQYSDVYQCTDPSDQIYALLGLQNEEKHMPLEPIIVDYSKPARQLYLETARKIIRSQQSLRVCASAPEQRTGGKVSNLPSWVPDWSAKATVYAFEYFNVDSPYFKADLRRRHRDVVTPDNVLRVRGHTIDTVVDILEIDIPRYSNLERLGGVLADDTLPLLKTILASRPMGLNSAQQSHKIIKTITLDGYTRQSDTGNFGLPDSAWDESNCSSMIDELLETPQAGKSKGWLSALAAQWWRCTRRQFAFLEHNTIALVPEATRVGDKVAIIHGLTLPIVLRMEPVCTMIGGCYVDGVMYGERTWWTEDEALTFDIH